MDDLGLFLIAGGCTAAFFAFTALLAGPLPRFRAGRRSFPLERRRWR